MTSRTIVEIHALQTVPPSNINRDDTGAPKSAVYGGVTRARVSSQAWKRATREHFNKGLDPNELGVRTKQVAELLAQRIATKREDLAGAPATALAVEILQAATGAKIEPPKRKSAKSAGGDDSAGEAAPQSSYLMFLSDRQLDGLADLAVEGSADIKAFLKEKENKDRSKRTANTRHSVDIALFGRMVANATDINVDAAAQVAHALSVHRVENESDYYTAVDDRNAADESGAGMIGTVDFNSATLYRYAAVDVDRLHDNLGKGLDENASPATPVRRAVEVFLDGFISSLPTGKINAFGNHTLPDVVIVKLRSTRPISFVSAFERPVTSDEFGGHLEPACERLVDYVPEIERAYGAEDTLTWVLRVGPATRKLADLGTEVSSIKQLTALASAAVAERLEKHG
ncbi:type I-E CRISPR-associated protein Cas7/Cse4/CasC [Kitasatospora sp. A2-31]|uniref:type I-E CRISPR-associated protein Cas7/Cse4/CasC n=1 Tax=Kitasatospora sp. A2-31 TaxID=2916414 RepID=UPI001EEA049F|nr:type I-E CRISPR-associated protein Cas7/Cse4/CasC [Kitasatospora sp. A2-31]MCG6493914.1 type I-E CRISPR-associated protein Cas7/Cse4/CasC [Kitasatospora sp. A2-31]